MSAALIGFCGRVRVLSVLMLILLALAGCDASGSYPADLAYPSRIDPLVIAVPGGDQDYPIPPGQLDESIRKINGNGDGKTLDPKELKESDRRTLSKSLATSFGKPAAPMVKISDEAPNAEKVVSMIKDLGLDDENLKKGSTLYRRHCLQCHGVPGDGRGPTGPWVSPPPRDYRRGRFKFISTSLDKPKPSRADLFRTLHNGLEGTTMPSFALLQEDELQNLVSYVIHLSLRGQCEFDALRLLLTKSLESDGIADNVESSLADHVEEWHKANASLIRPKEPGYKNDDKLRTSAIERGYKLFTKKGSICGECHVDFGRQARFKYEADWGTLVRPMNLTLGVYRGGRRPIDHFWRIRGGAGPVMPANREFSEDEVWDLVAFIQALPYPAMLPSSIRETIYGKKSGGSEVAGRWEYDKVTR